MQRRALDRIHQAGAADPGVVRRVFLGHGLAGLATALVAGCGDDSVPAPGAPGSGGAGAGGGGAGGAGGSGPALRSLIADIGPLGDADENGVRLPEGFSSRIVARTKEIIAGYEWHVAPDGGATFAAPDGGWVYVSNSEVPIAGGAGALRFDAAGEIVAAYRILDLTNINCAGGKTPWGTWLSCEEASSGRVWECDPFGENEAIERPALGIFKHEAVAVDPVRHHAYLTEDEKDGRLYRFVPAVPTGGPADLDAGSLEVAQVMGDGSVVWLPVPDPSFAGAVPTREQVPASTPFEGGEGIWYHDGVVYFSTKGDNHVRAYDVVAARMDVLYAAATAADPILTGVDNITVSCCGDVLVAEDPGDLQIVAILPDGTLKPLVQIVGHDGSEITGPAFDPSGTRLYFSSQRGVEGVGGGVTFEVTGPFHEPLE